MGLWELEFLVEDANLYRDLARALRAGRPRGRRALTAQARSPSRSASHSLCRARSAR
jgi:hypothetical protein